MKLSADNLYNRAVLALFSARQTDADSGLAVFIGKHAGLLGIVNDHWRPGMERSGLPSPSEVVSLLGSASRP